MLHLLSHPHWAACDDAAAALQPLPVTVPGALLVVLAVHGDWLDRERLAAIFWPEAAPGDALHHLRVNLHRARALAAGWGHGAALQAERTRVRLALASDVAGLGAAIAGNDAVALLRHRPLRWLDGYRLPAFGGFAEWCESEGRHLASAWRQACERALPQALRAGQVAAALALFEAWQADGGQALPGLEALDGTALDAEAAAAWRGLRHRLAGAAPPESALALPAPPGRAIEQQRLLGSGAVAVVVLGEPGVGKSTLLDSAFPTAPRLQGREGLDGLPYRPLLDVLRERLPLLRRWLAEPQAGIGAQLAPYRLDLARLLPELAPAEALPALDAWTAKARLVEALARCFEAFGATLRVDDLQWCDPATLEWLALLAHRGGLRWRATARRHELGAAAGAMLDALRAARLLDEQALLPLTRAGLAEACHALWPDLALDAPRLDRLYAASGGSPFIVNELVAAGGNVPAAGALPERASELVLRRLRSAGFRARRVVEAAAVFVQPVPAEALGLIAAETGETGGGAGTDADTEWQVACDAALGAGLLRAEGQRLVCAHDLIRHATLAAVGPTRTPPLHRRAALWLATQPEPDALAIAAHWRAAQEPQTALAWLHHGAGQLKSRGRFDEARALWRQVADASLDAAQSLRARLELAGVDFFDDLAASRAALEAVRVQIGAVADDLQRDQIEGRVLAALVDNRVFAGDLAQAREHAKRLRSLLPRLAEHERIDAIEVLIELAMREPDIEACWALLAQLRRAAPRRPSLLSFEGQIHWFSGNVRAARDALRQLLAAHPDHRSGITIENDLAVMLHALGELAEAETMARRSLQSWKGVAHTETLSLLVLGAVLTSAGRHAEADAALGQALVLAREQASPGFEAEAQVRRARLLLQCGRYALAQQALDAAAPLLAASAEPLRVSQYAATQWLVASASGRPPDPALHGRLHAIGSRSAHPWVQLRLVRVDIEQALAGADAARAAASAERMVAIARDAGLLEALAEALLLRVRAGRLLGEAAATLRAPALEAQTLAAAQGLADAAWRAAAWLDAIDGRRAESTATRAARRVLQGPARPALFDAAAAARREPGVTAPAPGRAPIPRTRGADSGG